MAKFRGSLLFLVFITFTGFPLSVCAQHSVGIQWEEPGNQKAAIEQLQRYHELGISILEIQSPLSSTTWEQIDSLGFEVYGNLGIKFPTASTFSDPDSSLINSIENKASAYLSQPSVQAINLFEYGALYEDTFWRGLQTFAEQIKAQRQIDLYFTHRQNVILDTLSADYMFWDVFISPENIHMPSLPQHSAVEGYIFSPSQDLQPYLTPFKSFIDLTIGSGKPILIKQNWLDSALDNHPEFAKTLQSITSKSEIVFPLPEESLPTSQVSVLPILLLLIVWGTLAMHFNSSPLYRKSLFRYFTAHKFFIEDIFQRYIRSSFPALLIILQNSFLLAACIYVTLSKLLTPLGQEAFLYHFALFDTFGSGLLSVFIWSLLLVLLISLLSILWLYLSHKRINSLTQIATIYAWPQQVNIILGTIIITLFSAGAGQNIIAAFTLLALIVFILSFFFASVDTVRFARSGILHQAKTSVLYLALWFAIVGWIVSNEQWMEVITLSLSLT